MAGIGSSITATRVTLANLVVASGVVKNIPVTLASTEYSHVLPTGIKGFLMRNRDNGVLQLSFTSGESGTVYFSLYPGEQFWKENLDGTSITIYFQSPKAGQTIEMIEWS